MENDTRATPPRLLCSTGAFTREQTHPDHRRILTNGPELGADGLEVIVYHPWYDHLDRVEHDLRASGISFPAVHSALVYGTHRNEPAWQLYRSLGFEPGRTIFNFQRELQTKG